MVSSIHVALREAKCLLSSGHVLHDFALVTEVPSARPTRHSDWEKVATTLSAAFSTRQKQASLKGRGCREQLELLVRKCRKEDSRALQRLGCCHFFASLSFGVCDLARVCLYDDKLCAHVYNVTSRSGTEEKYTALQQLLKDISQYMKDFAAARELQKGVSKKKVDEDKKKGD